MAAADNCPAAWTFGASSKMELNLTIPAFKTFPPMDSGYNSTDTTPDNPSPPINWMSLEEELNRLLADDDHLELNVDSADSPPLHDNIQFHVEDAQPFLTKTDVAFYLTAEMPATTKDLQQLAVVILGPSGRCLPMLQFTSLSDRVVCTFRPLLPGVHTIQVFHSINLVTGCPAKILISRNYEEPLRRIVTWDAEMPENDARPVLQRKPWGLACNTKTEQLWVADREQHQLLIYRPDGSLDFTVGHQGTGCGEFNRPTAIAFDASSDRFFVTDKDNHRVQIFTSDGVFLSSFGHRGSRDGELVYPWGVAVSPDGQLVAVADTRNHRIQYFDSNGCYLRQFRVSQRQQWKCFKNVFNSPRGLAFNRTGDQLYVTDFNLHVVFQLDVARNVLQTLVAPGLLLRPSGITVDNAGNLIVACSRQHTLRVFTPTGKPLRTIQVIPGSNPSDPEEPRKSKLYLPTDVTLMKAGFLALLDNNGRVTIF